MNALTYVLIALRAAALALAGRDDQLSSDLYALANAIKAGRVGRTSLDAVAALLEERKSNSEDWKKLFERINPKRAELHREAKPPLQVPPLPPKK